MRMIEPCRIALKGGGEMATGIAVALRRAGFRQLLILESDAPTAVRRRVCFSEAVYEGEQWVEGVLARRIGGLEDLEAAWRDGAVGLAVDPEWRLLAPFRPRVCVDAVLAKRNFGTGLGDARLVLALGPGFAAGRDAHLVVETQRGHNLGRVYAEGSAEPNTGVPGNIGGYTRERVLHAPVTGVVEAFRDIGQAVRAGEAVCAVGGVPVPAKIDGILRGLIRPGITIAAGRKIGDVDPRNRPEYCVSISEKARAIGGAVLLAVCGHLFNA